MPKLRIATLVTGHLTAPPPPHIVYAPMDLVMPLIAGLQQRGHHVTFYGPVGSKVSGVKVKSHRLPPLKKDEPSFAYKTPLDLFTWGKLISIWDQYLISHMFRAAVSGEFDLLHLHLPAETALALATAYPQVPVVVTLHDPIDEPRRDIWKLFSPLNQYYISISDSQRRPAPDIQYAATVYNGIDVTPIPFSEKPGSYLLCVGRVLPQKGAAEAIEAARQLGKKLIIIGPHYHDPALREYWEKKIKPHLGDMVEWTGYMPRQQIYEYYRQAYATLFPISWEEPFGLVMIESMATGTPVIGFRRGAVPEVIKDGQTGFIVDTVPEMVEAAKKIPAIDRRTCREHVEKNFSIEKMVEGYEQAYYAILERQAKK